jgi:hypothetical protein
MSGKIEYAKVLDYIGTKIVEISDGLKSNVPIEQCKNLDELKGHLQRLKSALKEYVECRNMLGLIKPPQKITDEHSQLIDAYEDFLDGTKLMIQSFSVENMAFNKFKYQSGYAKQTIGEIRVKDVVNRIVEKLNS